MSNDPSRPPSSGVTRERLARFTSLLAVVFAVFLMVSAPPVAALQTNTYVASSNFTDTELGAGTLTNSQVERSGTAGLVSHDINRSSAVARWAFDYGSGSTAYDHVGSNDGSISGPTWVSGVSGQALNFDGSGGDTVTPNTNVVSTGSYSISYWINLDSLSSDYRPISQWGNSNYDWLFRYLSSSGEYQFFVRDGSGDNNIASFPDTKISAGTWHHVTGVVDQSDGTVRIYLDGELMDTVQWDGTHSTNTNDLYIGEDQAGNSPLDGQIDDVRAYSEALTPGQVARLNKYERDTKLTATATERWAFDADRNDTAHGDEGSDGTINIDNPDIAFIDGSNNLKYVERDGTVHDTGEQANTVGGIADYDDDGDKDIFYNSTSADFNYIDKYGNVETAFSGTGGNLGDVGGMADIDGDGLTEIVYVWKGDVAHQDYQNNGVDIATGSIQSVGGIGDIDGDGDLDVAYIDGSDNLKYVDSAGNTADTGYDTTGDVGGVVDIGGDGDLDILFQKSDDIRAVDSGGTRVFVISNRADSIVGGAGDVDGDGDPDVAYKDTTGSLESASDGTTDVTDYPTGTVIDVGLMGDVNQGWVDGQAGNALDYDGTDDYTDIPEFSQFSSYTVTAWAKFDSINDGDNDRVVSIQGNNNIIIRENSGNIEFLHHDGTSYKTISTTASAGTWYFLAIKWDGSTVEAFVDGTSIGTASASGIENKNAADTIGSYQDGTSTFMDGTIDDVRVYDGNGLTQSEITHLNDHSGAQLNETSSYQQAHDVTNSVDGFTDLELHNASATVEWEGSNDGGATWSSLASTTVTTTQNLTQSWSEYGGDDVRVNVSFDPSHPDHTARLHDEGVNVTNTQPIVDNSTASPDTTSTTVNSATPQLSINVNDTDFPTAQGDSVDIDWYVDGSLDGTSTIAANATPATHTSSSLDGGTHTWHVEIEDTNGLTNTSATFDMAAPAEVDIRNETNESQKITKSADVIVYARDGIPIDNRPTATGTIDMTGLPTGDNFIIQVNVSDFGQRTVYIDNLYEQSNIFMLNQTEHATARVEFVVTDNTGDFPPDTSVIKIQRGLNRTKLPGSETGIRWITVTGDVLGADRTHTGIIQRYTRYRILVENTDGDQSILGEYSTDQDDTVPLTIGQRSFDFTAESSDDITYSANMTASGNTEYVRFSLNDDASETTDVGVRIYERNNESNVIYDSIHPGPYGTLSISQPVPSQYNDTSWMVQWNATKPGVDDPGATVSVGPESIQPGTDAAPWVKQSTAFAITVLVFMVTSGGANRYVGSVVTPLAAGLFYAGGWMPPEVGAGVVIFALAIGSGYFMQGSQGSGF